MASRPTPKRSTTRRVKPAAKPAAKPARKAAIQSTSKAAATAADFARVFAGLKRLLLPYARRMAVKHDAPGIYYLESNASNRYGEPVFFGAVRTGKAYVSYHLMPIYVFPDLAKDLSPELKKRRQGKSCFNFRTFDRAMFAELAELTRRGFEAFDRGGVFGG